MSRIFFKIFAKIIQFSQTQLVHFGPSSKKHEKNVVFQEFVRLKAAD
jgi:hypothetical protein